MTLSPARLAEIRRWYEQTKPEDAYIVESLPIIAELLAECERLQSAEGYASQMVAEFALVADKAEERAAKAEERAAKAEAECERLRAWKDRWHRSAMTHATRQRAAEERAQAAEARVKELEADRHTTELRIQEYMGERNEARARVATLEAALRRTRISLQAEHDRGNSMATELREIDAALDGKEGT